MASIDDYPLQPPPAGAKSNFVNPESRGPVIVAICYTFISLMWLILLSRLYSKAWVICKVGWDDAFATLAAIGATFEAAGIIWLVGIGAIGPHEWNVRAVVITVDETRVSILGGVLLYSLTMLFAKLALFLLYYRLFASDYWTKIAIYLGIITACLFYIACAITFFILCLPRPGESWISPRFTARCAPMTHVGSAQAWFGLLSDLYIFFLPLPVLWGLHMPLMKRLRVAAVFLTGLIAIVAICFGIYYRSLEASVSDYTWNGPPASGTAVVEVTIGVICGSVPNLPALFRQVAPRLSSITESLLGLLFSCGSRSRKSYELPRHNLDGFNPKPKTPGRRKVETDLLANTQRETRDIRRTSGTQLLSGHPEGAILPPVGCATRRNHYDIGINTDILSSDQTSQPPPQDIESSVETAGSENSTDRSDISRKKGYWDIMSIFRSGNANSTARSGSWPRSRSGRL